MNSTSTSISGIGKIERGYLASILSNTTMTISTEETTNILDMPRSAASKVLFNFAKKGWISRIAPGIYLPVPLTSSSSNITTDEPFALAEKIFSPCYIGGWSAAEYWGMTEQLFQTVIVMTQQQKKNYRPIIANTQYQLHLTRNILFFGLETIWQNNVKIKISNPTRTIVDFMSSPEWGGGIRLCADILKNYMRSEKKSVDLLIGYLEKLNNGAAYKRLGFLVEKYFPEEIKLLNECKTNASKGKSKLDSSLNCNKLATKWQLWVPESWKKAT